MQQFEYPRNDEDVREWWQIVEERICAEEAAGQIVKERY
jgi:hypothetical protein